MANKLIVLSVDSLFDEDMDQLAGLPNIGRLIRRGSYVRRPTASTTTSG